MKNLEDCILNDSSILIELNLQFHDISTSGGSNQSSADILFGLIERANIARVFVVVDHLLVIRLNQFKRQSSNSLQKGFDHQV